MKVDIPVPGYALAMTVLQSDLYQKLGDKERAVCDALIAKGQALTAFELTPLHLSAGMNWWNTMEPKQKQMLVEEHGMYYFRSAIDIAKFWIAQHPRVAQNMEDWK